MHLKNVSRSEDLQETVSKLKGEQADLESRHREQVRTCWSWLKRPLCGSSWSRKSAASSGCRQGLTLQQAHAQLAEEYRALDEKFHHRLEHLDTELAQARQKHDQEPEVVQLDSENLVAVSRRKARRRRRRWRP